MTVLPPDHRAFFEAMVNMQRYLSVPKTPIEKAKETLETRANLNKLMNSTLTKNAEESAQLPRNDQSGSLLLQLPPELLGLILDQKALSLKDLASFTSTCRKTRASRANPQGSFLKRLKAVRKESFNTQDAGRLALSRHPLAKIIPLEKILFGAKK